VQRGVKPKEIYESHYRTSLYNTFQAKVAALTMNNYWFNPILLDPNETSGLSIDDFGVAVTGNELFDRFDQEGFFNGDNTIQPLIQPVADLNVTPGNWYTGTIYPYMYQHFPAPAQNIVLTWRDPALLGNVPDRAVWITQEATPHQLTQGDIETGAAAIPQPNTAVVYRLPYHMIFDHFDYKNKLANYVATNPNLPQAWQQFLQGQFTYPAFGDYRMVLRYILPGAASPNSQVPVTIRYQESN
jgi:hypothetical protein